MEGPEEQDLPRVRVDTTTLDRVSSKCRTFRHVTTLSTAPMAHACPRAPLALSVHAVQASVSGVPELRPVRLPTEPDDRHWYVRKPS